MKVKNIFMTVCGIAAMILAAIYFMTDNGDKTFSSVAAILLFIGGVVVVAGIKVKKSIAKLLGAIVISCAAGFAISVTVPTITDIFNGVVFVGGNQTAAVAFLTAFLLVGLLNVINCFISE